MSVRPLFFVATASIVLSAATCKDRSHPSLPSAGTTPKTKMDAPDTSLAPPNANIPGVDLSLVPPTSRAEFLALMNETYCYCGCPRSLAACLSAEADCSCLNCSRRMTKFILDQYQAGLLTQEVELELLDGFSEGFNGKKFDFNLKDHATKGSSDAKFVFVEFADFACPHCRAAFQPLNRLVEENKDVRLVYFYFPLGAANDGPTTVLAEAAEEARVQGKFWEMAALLFEHQGSADPNELAKLAGQIGLDVPRFKAALMKRTHKDKVHQDKDLGRSANVESTPAIFVNGRPFGLRRTLENFKLRIEMEAGRERCD